MSRHPAALRARPGFSLVELLITMVMLHVYFALRPEKLKFTRAMIRGWITRREFDEHHDPNRWQVDR